MTRTHLALTTNLAYAKGAYSVAIELGSEGCRANVLLDTGSSTLVVLPSAYRAELDQSLQATTLGQQVRYGQGAWAGPVLHVDVAFGEGRHARRLPSAQLSLVEAAAQNFRDCDGLLGLAYRNLDKAHDLSAILTAQNVTPAQTWPWPFVLTSDADLAEFRSTLLKQPTVTLTPLFSAFEQEGVVADKFAMLIRRALVHVLDETATLEHLAADPLNRGVLVLGGGEECEDLYRGAFHDIRIVHDLYYNANLIAVSVGDEPRLPAPPLDAADVARAASNAIFDTGSSFLVLETSLYDGILAAFERHDARLPGLVERCQNAFASEHGLPNEVVDPREWPDLHFHLESATGGEVTLACPASHYWQRNALHAGESLFLLMSQLPNWPKQSILGLPLLSGHYCIFDRRAQGSGVLRVAKAQDP